MVATAFQHTESVSVQSIEVKNVDASAGTFDVFVKGVKADCGVESVQLQHGVKAIRAISYGIWHGGKAMEAMPPR